MKTVDEAVSLALERDPQLVTREAIPTEFFRQFYSGSVGGFGPWLDRVLKQVEEETGMKLVKIKGQDIYVPSTPEHHLRRANRHGAKAVRQKRYQVNSYQSLARRDDAPEQLRADAEKKRDKAAGVLADMSTKQRLRDRLSKLLEGK